MRTEDNTASDLIAIQWQRVIDYVADARHKVSHAFEPLIPVARSDPILGRLFPFVSISGLCFSRCTETPYYVDLLIQGTDTSDYVVVTTDGHGSWTKQWEIGTGDAQTAVRIARAFLPADYPPAIHGNRDDLQLDHDPTTIRLRAARSTG